MRACHANDMRERQGQRGYNNTDCNCKTFLSCQNNHNENKVRLLK